MQSRSLKYALRATIRACLVAASTASTVYADWNAPNLSIPVSCMVHDSGMEFLPIQFHPIDTGAHYDGILNQAPANRETTLTSPAIVPPSSQLDHCVALAGRRERLDQLLAAETWIQNFGRRSLSAVSQGALQVSRIQGQLLARWNQSVPTILDRLADARRATEAQQPLVQDSAANLADATGPYDACFATELLSSDTSTDAIASLTPTVEQDSLDPIEAETAVDNAPIAIHTPANHLDRCIGSSDVDLANLCPAYPSPTDHSAISTPSDAFGILPSGQTANLFVFTLSVSESPDSVAPQSEASEHVPDDCSNAPLSTMVHAFDAPDLPTDANATVNESTEDFAPYNDIENEMAENASRFNPVSSQVICHENANFASTDNHSTPSPESFVTDAIIDAEASTNESELCLPLSCRTSQCGPGTDQSFPSAPLLTVPINTQSPSNTNSPLVDVVSGWRSLFRPDSCIFGPELAQANSVLFGGPSDSAESNDLPRIEPTVSDSRPPTLEIPSDEPISSTAPILVQHESYETRGPSEPTVSSNPNINPIPDNASSVSFTPSTWLGMAIPPTESVNSVPIASSEPLLPETATQRDLADEAKHQALGIEQVAAPESEFVAIASNPAPSGSAASTLPAIAPLEPKEVNPVDIPTVPSIESSTIDPLPIDGTPTESIDALLTDPIPAPMAPSTTPTAEFDPIDFQCSEADSSLDGLAIPQVNGLPQAL